jgi:hypothetical protein
MIIFDHFVVVCERFYLRIFLKRSEKSEHSKALEQIAENVHIHASKMKYQLISIVIILTLF